MNAKVAVITGAARRVGAEIAHSLHQAGYSLMLHYRQSANEATALAKDLNRARPGSAALVAADLRVPGSAAQVIAATKAAFGRLDALVHNASSFYPTPVGSIRESDWEDLVGTNLKAPLFLAQAARPLLEQSGGGIVFLTDIHAQRPIREHAVYSLAKGGLHTLTRALAQDLGPGIRVNAVAPGYVLWPEENPQFAPDRQAAVIARTPLGRLGTPQDIAAAVRFLLESPFLSGVILPVDGGFSAGLG